MFMLQFVFFASVAKLMQRYCLVSPQNVALYLCLAIVLWSIVSCDALDLADTHVV